MLSECQVLIIEPDARMRLDLGDLLKRAGYQVLTAAGVLDALYVLNQVRVQLVICASELIDALRYAVVGGYTAPSVSSVENSDALVVTDTAQVDTHDLWTVILNRPVVVDELLSHVAQRLARRRDYVRTEAD
ncbi:MAG: hypothetical protein IPM16_11380 [Chloroflexi bacterium]|nr:hypothetical protein [Chloroflexota bacterium]